MSAPIITTGQVAALLRPGLRSRWGNAYNEHPKEWPDLVDTFTSDMAYEEDQQLTGFGMAPIKTEGASMAYDTQGQGYVTRYRHIAYALGFIITHEAIKDNLYEKIGMQRTGSLAFSFRQTKENVVANLYNRAFNSSYTGGDGKELLATDHPSAAGTWSNELTTAADFSEASLEDLVIQMGQAVNDRGLKIAIQPRKLIIPVGLQFEAARVLLSTGQPNNSNNDINALKQAGIFANGWVVNHYLTDPDAFFIRTNIPADQGLKLFQREELDFDDSGDFDTKNIKYGAYERYSVGWTDPHALYGSPGA
jgi:hypothetical protein